MFFCCRAQGCTSASVFSCISLKAHFSGCRNQECPGRMGRRPERILLQYYTVPSGSYYNMSGYCCPLESWKFLLPPPGFNQRPPYAWPVTNDHPTPIILERKHTHQSHHFMHVKSSFPSCPVAINGLLQYFHFDHPIYSALKLALNFDKCSLQSMMRLEIDTNWTPCGIG